MKTRTLFLLIPLLFIVFPACELTEEEENGQNNPTELVGKWNRESIKVGLEVVTNSNQSLVDISKPGVGSGISIVGDNLNESLKHINPMFMFFKPDDDNGGPNGNDNGEPHFFFAVQNLDWTVFEKPEDFIGQSLKMFLMMKDKEWRHHPDGTEMDTIVTRAVYFEWIINDTSNFFMGDRPPDSLYIADRVDTSSYSFDKETHELVLSNISLYFAEIHVISESEDSLVWDSSRVSVASGNLKPATFSINANTPTLVSTPKFKEGMSEGPPESVDLHDDGTLDLVDIYLECDDYGNCNEVTEYLTGDWWTEGLDTLILAITESDGEIDTVDLKYLVAGNELNIVHRENPCVEDDYWESEDECLRDMERGLIGIQQGSLTSMEMVMNLTFKKESVAGKTRQHGSSTYPLHSNRNIQTGIYRIFKN